MSGALCIKCGAWKQAPTARCGCGFAPARGTVDIARSYICSEQFRSPEQLEEMAGAIRSGTPVSFNPGELRVASGIGKWNMAVNLGLVLAVALATLLVTGLSAGFPAMANVTLGAAFAVALVLVYVLTKIVDSKVARARRATGRAGAR